MDAPIEKENSSRTENISNKSTLLLTWLKMFRFIVEYT